MNVINCVDFSFEISFIISNLDFVRIFVVINKSV